jgi:hypothetical protein
MTDKGFLSGARQGAGTALKEAADSATALVHTGHALATDPQAREAAWQTARETAASARAFAAHAAENPGQVWRDAKQSAGEALTAAETFRQQATAEDWGRLAGGGAVNLGLAAVPGGAAAKLARLRRAGRLPDAPKPAVVAPCPAAVATTKQRMRLRPDLGPEHFHADGSLKWPDNDGFAGVPTRRPMKPKEVIDRYHTLAPERDSGSFFAAAGTPYEARSLPYDARQMRHTRFRVLKAFEVDAGPAAPAFDQRGGGMQYTNVRVPSGQTMGVKDLLQHGYLEVLP